MVYWVYAVGKDEKYPFVCESGLRAAMNMIYYLCVKAKKDYSKIMDKV